MMEIMQSIFGNVFEKWAEMWQIVLLLGFLAELVSSQQEPNVSGT